MRGEADDVKVSHRYLRLPAVSERIWIPVPIISITCLFLVLVYGLLWAFILWPLGLGLVAVLLVSGVERVRSETESRADCWIYVSCRFNVPSRMRKVPGAGRQCPVCGNDFEGHARKRYCSPRCRRRAVYVRHADARRQARAKRCRSQKTPR